MSNFFFSAGFFALSGANAVVLLKNGSPLALGVMVFMFGMGILSAISYGIDKLKEG